MIEAKTSRYFFTKFLFLLKLDTWIHVGTYETSARMLKTSPSTQETSKKA